SPRPTAARPSMLVGEDDRCYTLPGGRGLNLFRFYGGWPHDQARPIVRRRDTMKNSSAETKPRSPSQRDERGTGGKKRLRPLDIHRLVDEDGRVPGSNTDAAIVKQGEVGNRQQGSWLFVAHESEIPNPGDYKALTLAQQPVIVVRGDDGRVRVL